jgi:hypothetical protein
MNNKEKSFLLMVVTGLLLSGLAYLSIFWLPKLNVNPFYFLVLMVLFIQVILIPSLVGWYLRLRGYTPSLTKHIPVYNEYSVFPSKLAKGSVYSFFIACFIGLLMLLPYMGIPVLTKLIRTIFGSVIAMQLNYRLFPVFLIASLSYWLFSSVGYLSIFRYTRNTFIKDFGGKKSKGISSFYDNIQYILIFIPLLRAIPLYDCFVKLRRIVVFDQLEKTNNREFKKVKEA